MGAVEAFLDTMQGWSVFGVLLVALVFDPLRIVLTCIALAMVGVGKKERIAWARNHADRRWLVDLIRAVRGKDELPSSSEPSSEQPEQPPIPPVGPRAVS